MAAAGDRVTSYQTEHRMESIMDLRIPPTGTVQVPVTLTSQYEEFVARIILSYFLDKPTPKLNSMGRRQFSIELGSLMNTLAGIYINSISGLDEESIMAYHNKCYVDFAVDTIGKTLDLHSLNVKYLSTAFGFYAGNLGSLSFILVHFEKNLKEDLVAVKDPHAQVVQLRRILGSFLYMTHRVYTKKKEAYKNMKGVIFSRNLVQNMGLNDDEGK